MRGQQFADFANRLDQRVAKLLVLKMRPHSFDNMLPELVATFLVNGFIADDGELVRAWRDENQNRVLLTRLVHAKLMKLFLRCSEWIAAKFAALNINTNLAGSFRFTFANRVHDPVMLKLAEEFSASHLLPARSGSSSAKTASAAAESTKAATASRRPASSAARR